MKPMTEVNDKGCNMGSIYAWKDGIISRAVLMDIPRLKGVDYLEPGTKVRVVSAEDEYPATVTELPFVRGSWYTE